jgi:hypothetical protein
METVTVMGTPFNVLSSLFHDALARVDWQEGVIQALQMQEAEDNLERAWREAEEGSIPLEVFKEVLGEWGRAVSKSRDRTYTIKK